MKVVTRAEIEAVLPRIDLVSAIGKAFVSYSEGRAIVPPVGEILAPQGEVHVKSGCLVDGRFIVVKIAAGFYGNRQLGLPSGSGLMVLLSQETGRPAGLLLDEGLLTDLRTAAAGAVAARALASHPVRTIGIIGTGVQARLQLELLAQVTDCRTAMVFGRSREREARYAEDLAGRGFTVSAAPSTAALGEACNLIVTTTASRTPLLRSGDVRPGTHVTAIGSDTTEKQELAVDLVAAADVVVADSRAQCRLRGEIHHALAAGFLEESRVVEIGEVLAGRAPGRTAPDQRTLFDSTGVAVQDVAIAAAVMDQLEGSVQPFPVG